MIGRGGSGFKARRRNSRLIFATLFFISLVLYLASVGNDQAFKDTRSNVEGVGAKALTYLTLPFRGLENLSADIVSRWNAHAENEQLRKEVSRLADAEARLNNLNVKLSRFETILNVESRSEIPEQKVAARAVSENDGPFAKTALINVGARQGVSDGDAVMTVDGLYGHIIRTGNSSSRVLKLEDLNSRISVMSKSNQARAILIGDNSKNPTLSYVAEDSDWQDGDEIITSGDDGVLPMGLPIGSVFLTPSGDWKVRLFVNRNFVDWVWVYPYEPISTPEEDPAPTLDELASDKIDENIAAEDGATETPL